MKTREILETMRPKERFETIRRRQNDKINLRLRMTLIVCAELVVSLLISVGITALLRPYVDVNFKFLLPVVLIGTSLLLSASATTAISHIFLDPIKKLREAMGRIADGDFTVRLEEESFSKEIIEVYTGFNMMAHELGATEMLQSDFVSNVSHEFKTPINAIEGYSTLLQGSDNLSPDQEAYVEKILFNTQRLSSLMGSILLLSKLENQQIQTHQTVFRLDEQIRQSIVGKEAEWEKKDIEFDVEMDSIDYTGNEPMMRHVWDNLIGNAIKFDPQCGLIRIRLTRQEGIIRFTIEDSGPGLTEEAQKHLYDKFYQADSSHKEEGNGLGLALVKRILTLENGHIHAENINGGGCRFTVELQDKTN